MASALLDQGKAYRSERPGKRLKLRGKPDNPYDPNAVSMWCGKVKIGFVPRSRNQELAKMLFFRRVGAFEVTPPRPTLLK